VGEKSKRTKLPNLRLGSSEASTSAQNVDAGIEGFSEQFQSDEKEILFYNTFSHRTVIVEWAVTISDFMSNPFSIIPIVFHSQN
jgi:hypothetical protein